MKKIYIYEINRQTMKKRLFRIVLLGYSSIKNFVELNEYINRLDDDKYYYTWEVA